MAEPPAADAIVGVATPVVSSVWRVLAPNPGMMTGPGTNTYLVGDDHELAVIDPGPDDEAHLDAVARAGGGRIRWILATHTHLDHAPGAAGLRARTGAAVLGYDARDDFEPERELRDGDRVEVGGVTLRAVHTPGHASNHLCYLLEERSLLFSGDHVMQGSTVVIRPPDGDMVAYLDSLRRVLDLHPDAIAPGHGRRIDDPGAVVSGYLRHRAERERAIAGALDAQPATVDELVAAIYVDVDPKLHPVARHSVLAHLLKLAGEGRVVAPDGDALEGRWLSRSNKMRG